MTKGRGQESTMVKFQVPVPTDLADEIAELASRMQRSQGWMASALLEEAINNRRKLKEWFALRVIEPLAKTARKIRRRGGKRHAEGETVRLQVSVPDVVANRLEHMAGNMEHTMVKTAAMLLDWAVTDHGWLIHVVTSRLARTVIEAVDPKRKPKVSMQDRGMGRAR